MPIHQLTQIESLLNLQTGFPNREITNFQVDSRQCTPGSLFIALKGECVDGHHFIHQAIEKGAVASIVSDSFDQPIQNHPLIRVKDPLKTLQALATYQIKEKSYRVVGVTGSVGKTTTKEWLKRLLSAKYTVASSLGNQNSQVGLPLTCLNQLKGHEDVVILEMGMTLPGHIRSLVEIAPPEVSLITTVSSVHIENFESLDGIAAAKAEILSHPKTKVGVILHGIPQYAFLQNSCPMPLLSFSLDSPEADYRYVSLDPLVLYSRQEDLEVPLNVPSYFAPHQKQNLLGAVAIARYFDVSWEHILQVLPFLGSFDKRLEMIEHPKALFLNDSYNACELSMKAALEILPPSREGGRKIAVLGSMLELGKFSEEVHRRVGLYALDYVDLLYCLGEASLPMVEVWKKENRPVKWFRDRESLVEELKRTLNPKDSVLLKGSCSNALWKVIEEIE